MKRIMIVEDEHALRAAYVILFKTLGYKVFEASNGKAAIETLASAKPDVIILDILMPVMGGVEFLRTADLKAKYPKSKVLVLSNLSDQKTIDEITRLGAAKYMLKSSASPSQLADAVKNL